MRQKSLALIDQYIHLTREFIQDVDELKQEPLSRLNYKKGKSVWSVLETLEHLNLYGDFYIPEIRSQIEKSKHPASDEFKSGVLGNYFVNALKPKAKLNTMKTFKDKDPNGSQLNKDTIDRFLDQQKQMIELLDQARNVDLKKTKTAISISKWIKLRLGDTFGVVIYHNQRHLVQVRNTLAYTS